MMISDGKGMQADSMPMSRVMPTYPEAEMVAMMKWARKARIFSVIRGQDTCRLEETLCYFGAVSTGSELARCVSYLESWDGHCESKQETDQAWPNGEKEGRKRKNP